MANTLNDTKVAVLATDGYEQSELTEPIKALKNEGATVHVVSPEAGQIKGWKDGNWGDPVDVDITIKDALGRADEYDALVLPGGVMNPDKLRMREDATEFVRAFFKAGKPVGAICHGPQILIDCGVIEGREVTSFPSIKNDLEKRQGPLGGRRVRLRPGLGYQPHARRPPGLQQEVDRRGRRGCPQAPEDGNKPRDSNRTLSTGRRAQASPCFYGPSPFRGRRWTGRGRPETSDQ